MPHGDTPKDVFAERLAQLPPQIQKAIRSADIEKRLRDLAGTHKLHLDQWALLENEVKLALYGFEDATNLANNIKSEVGVQAEEAALLAQEINIAIFEPVREELERELSHPAAQDEKVSDVDAMRNDMLAQNASDDVAASAPAAVPLAAAALPPTPPPAPPTDKAVREPLPGAYHPAQPSTERKSVAGDPYRVPAV